MFAPLSVLPSLQVVVGGWTHVAIDMGLQIQRSLWGQALVPDLFVPHGMVEAGRKGRTWCRNGGRVACGQQDLTWEQLGFEDAVATTKKARSS